MNQTSLVGRPLAALTAALVGFAERRGVWSGPLTSSSPELARLWGGTPSSTGVQVNEAAAYTYSVFWACVNNISTDIASFPLNLYKREPDGGKTLLSDHKLFPLLHDAPNPEMTAFTFRGLLTSNALTSGMGYAEIVRDGAGRVASLWPITPSRVTVRRDTRPPYRVYYDVARWDNGIDRLSADQMFVLPGSTHDGVFGRNIMEMARESIGLGLASERFGGTFFGNGATFGGVFQHPGRLTDTAIKNFRESVNAQHQGVDRAHRFIVVEENMTYHKLGVDPNAAQFVETRQFQIEEMCRWFRMPPHKVQHLIRTSYNSVEQMNIEYSTDTLTPWCVRWEQELKRQLIAPLERRIQFFKHNMDSKLRGDTASRYEAYTKGIQNGFLSADDVREKEDMNPLPNGSGKKYFLQSNTQPLDRVDEIIDKQVKSEPAPKPKTTDDDGDDEGRTITEALRVAMEASEARAAAIAEKIATVEAAYRSVSDASGAKDAALASLQAQQAEQRIEFDRLTALHAEAVARAERLAAEKAAVSAEVDAERAAHTATMERLSLAEQASTDFKAMSSQLQSERDALSARCASSVALVEQMTVDHAAAVEALQHTVESEQQARAQEIAAQRKVLTDAEAVRDAQIAALAKAEDDLRAAAAHAVTLDTNVAALKAELAAVTAARDDARQQAAAAADKLQQATADAVAAKELLDEEMARSQAERDAHTATKSALDAVSLAVTSASTAATHALDEATAIRTDAEKVAIDYAAKLEAEQAARAMVEATLSARLKAEADWRQAMMLTHRDTVADVAQRLIRREVERARRNQGTPAKLRAWSEAFYLDQEDVYVDALRAAMRTHLVFMQSDKDVDDYTRDLVRPHLTAAVAQLRTVADGDPDDYPVTLERLLVRWEATRPSVLADLVLQEEVAYVRSL